MLERKARTHAYERLCFGVVRDLPGDEELTGGVG